MLITIFVFGIISIFLIELYDDKRKRKKFFHRAQLLINENIDKFNDIKENSDCVHIEGILAGEFKKYFKSSEPKVKICLLEESKCRLKVSSIFNSVTQGQTVIKKKKNSYYAYKLIKNNLLVELLVVIKIRKNLLFFQHR